MVFSQENSHLLLTRIVTQGGPNTAPNAAESFSIYNPTEYPINLNNYYVCDDNDYYKIHTQGNKSPSNESGFTAKFPNIDIKGRVVNL